MLASQKFLKGLKSLPTFDDVKQKQKLHLEATLAKCLTFSTESATSIMSVLDSDIWTESELQHFKLIISEKTTHEVNTRRSYQDFVNLPYYLTPAWWNFLQTARQPEECLQALSKLSAKLGLRCPSEATYGTIVYLACFLFRPDQTEKEKLRLLEEYKPKIKRWIGGLPASGPYVVELPQDPARHHPGWLSAAFPEGCEPNLLPGMKMEDITHAIQQLRLRRGKSIDADLGNSLRENPDGNWRAMGEFMAGLMSKKVAGDAETRSVSSGSCGDVARSVPLLALMDGTVDEPTRPSEMKGEVMAALPKKSSHEDPAAVMEGELDEMRQALAGVPGSMKRPSGKKEAKKEAKAASQKGKPKAVGLKRPASSKAKPVPAASSSGKSLKRPAAAQQDSGDDYRKRLLATVPRALREKFAKGCSSCRYRPYCCNSCWHKKGFHG